MGATIANAFLATSFLPKTLHKPVPAVGTRGSMQTANPTRFVCLHVSLCVAFMGNLTFHIFLVTGLLLFPASSQIGTPSCYSLLPATIEVRDLSPI